MRPYINNAGLYGYFGILQQPHSKNYETSIFSMTDEDRSELNMIISQPESFMSAMNLCRRVHFKTINIFAISYDINFLSSIFNLANMLRNSNLIVNTIFPENIEYQSNIVFTRFHQIANSFQSLVDPSMGIKYIPTKIDGVYDVLVIYQDKTIYMSTYINQDKLKAILIEYPDISEIHIPFTNSLYGGLTYRDLMELEDMKPFLTKCVVNSFGNHTEYIYFKDQPNVRVANLFNTNAL